MTMILRSEGYLFWWQCPTCFAESPKRWVRANSLHSIYSAFATHFKENH